MKNSTNIFLKTSETKTKSKTNTPQTKTNKSEIIMKYTCKSLKKFIYFSTKICDYEKQTHVTYLYWATRTVILIKKNVLNLFDIYLLIDIEYW